MVILSLRNLLGVTICTIVGLLALLHVNLTGRQAEAVLNQAPCPASRKGCRRD